MWHEALYVSLSQMDGHHEQAHVVLTTSVFQIPKRVSA